MAGAKLEPFYNIVKHPNYPDGYAVVSCVSQEIFDSAVSFKPDSGDHFIVSYPKCGTTWMMNIMYLMKNGGAPLAKGDSMDNHIPFLEFVGGEVPAALTRPRTIKSHFYYDLIPKNSEAKYVFVARNPKDCLVSFYHHTVGFNEYYKYKEGTFDNFFEIFIEGRCDSGDYFKLVPEWYQQSLLHDNIHFVLYEDLKNDIQKLVTCCKVCCVLLEYHRFAKTVGRVFEAKSLTYASTTCCTCNAHVRPAVSRGALISLGGHENKG